MSAPRIDFGLGTIRPWRRADRAALLRHANDPAIPRYLASRFPHPYTGADADAWLDLVTAQASLPAFALEVGGEAVGGIGLRLETQPDLAHGVEIGYWLGQALWGRGVMTAAVGAFVPWAVAEHGFSRVAAHVATGNPGSVRVLEKSGFQREGLLRRRAIRDGIAQDHWLFARLFDPADGQAGPGAPRDTAVSG